MAFYIKEVGKRIEIIIVGVSLMGASVKYSVQKPDGTIVIWTASIDSVEEGITSYLLVAGDLNISGCYKINPQITLVDSSVLYGSVVNLYVDDLYT